MKIKFPPVKYNLKSIPEKLIYERLILNKYHDFTLCTTTKPYKIAVLTCVESKRFLKNNKTEPSLFLSLLKCNPQKEGLGTEMLNFAIKYSKKQGLGGRIHGLASTVLAPKEVPHLFYKKFGFNSEDAELNIKMDKFIKSNKTATSEDFPDIAMFYPAVQDFYPQESKQKRIWEKVKTFLKMLNIKLD